MKKMDEKLFEMLGVLECDREMGRYDVLGGKGSSFIEHRGIGPSPCVDTPGDQQMTGVSGGGTRHTYEKCFSPCIHVVIQQIGQWTEQL